MAEPKYLQVDEPLLSARRKYIDLKRTVCGYGWTRDDNQLPVALLDDLSTKFEARIEAGRELKRLALRNQMTEPDERDGPDTPGCSVLMRDAGGGRRVIRGTVSLGG